MLSKSSSFSLIYKVSVLPKTRAMNSRSKHDKKKAKETKSKELIDFSNFFIKPDHFEGIHVLEKTIEGAPNFRQLRGFPIYGTGQPSRDGILEVLNKVKNGQENQKIYWFLMRQEPVVYVNGFPYSLRHQSNPHRNIKLELATPQIPEVGRTLAQHLKERCSESRNNSLKIHVDKEFSENPLEREDTEVSIDVESVDDMESLLALAKDKCNIDLKFIKVPATEDNMPSFHCFDMIVNVMKSESASTPCIFSCQMGKGRTTAGMLVAALVKEISIIRELR